MTDQQKLDIIKREWQAVSESWDTLTEFRTFLDKLPSAVKQKVIVVLKNRIEEIVGRHSSMAQTASTEGQELAAFGDELDTYLN